MDAPARSWVNRHRDTLTLTAILAVALMMRLFHLTAPIADNLQAKQAYSSNKARSIAREPFNPMRLSMDLLDESGKPMELAEEVPVYIGMVGAAFHWFGETPVWGRLLSIVGSLIAIIAFFDLTKRVHGARIARPATALFAVMPLFVFYGRAVLPDPWMLAMMLSATAAFERFLDTKRWQWWTIAAITGALAVLFKYWGLMILLVFAVSQWRDGGVRAWFRPAFIALLTCIVAPTLCWLLLVFAPAPNPVETGWVSGHAASPYLVLQDPRALWNRSLYSALFSRFLIRDSGPIAGVLMLVGLWALIRGRAGFFQGRTSLFAWSGMGLLFYFLLAPKLIDHDYYELMMLPPVATLAAVGYCALRGDSAAPRWRRGLAHGLIAAAFVAHSPWVAGGMFDLERGKVELAQSIRRASAPSDRIVVMGPGIAQVVVVHYSERLGWVARASELPPEWPSDVARWQAHGAAWLALYFDAKTEPQERASYQPMIDSLPIVDSRRSTALSRHGLPEYEYILLQLDHQMVTQSDHAGDALRR